MNVTELLQSIMGKGGPQIAENFTPFGDEFRALIRLQPHEVSDIVLFEAAVSHAFSYFTWKWDAVVFEYLTDLGAMIEAWSASPKATLNLLCILSDFHYFVVWCFTASNEAQCRLSIPVMRRLGERFAFGRRDPMSRPLCGRRLRVVWLATYAESHGPMSATVRLFSAALLAGGYDLIVYAWREHDDAFLDWLRAQGATCRVFNEARPQLVIEAIERELDVDGPDVVVADMNIAVPMALFARRAAPAQIFLQAGPPAWPSPGLDAVFNSFGFDPDLAGWGSALEFPLDPPWDVDALTGSVSEEELAAERDGFPQNLRLIGSYGRLVKVTSEYLRAAEGVLMRCPEVGVVLGGTGDAAHIRDFRAESPVGDRIFLEERFVSKHVWGRMLDVFLDTSPITGGESAREMLAKGKPVVTVQNMEMPAILRQRDPAFIAADWTEYENLVVDLLTDSVGYAQASANARALASRMSDPGPFTDSLNRDIRHVLAEVIQRG